MFKIGEWSTETSEGNALVHELFGDISKTEPQTSKDQFLRLRKKKKKKQNQDITTGRKKAAVMADFDQSNLKETSLPKQRLKKKRSKTKKELDNEYGQVDFSVACSPPKKQRKHLPTNSPPLKDAVVETILDLETTEKKKESKSKRQKQKNKPNQSSSAKTIHDTDLGTNTSNNNQIRKRKKKNFNDEEKIRKRKKNRFHDEEKTSLNAKDSTDEEISNFPEVSEENFTSSGRNESLGGGTFSSNSVSNFQKKMISKLEASQFRWINEKLYTISGQKAMELFTSEPALFDVYHRGFHSQVKQWSVNPVDVIIKWLKERPPSLVVADFGCGEAEIAQSVPNKVYSFDLVAKNKFVTACDMAKVPIPDESVDIVVFCLSLMGTNLTDFLREARRVLKQGGIVEIAEVTSRIEDSDTFIQSLSQLGFQLKHKDSTSKMFVIFEFSKSAAYARKDQKTGGPRLELKPCIYKRR